MDITITITKTYTEEEVISIMRLIKMDKARLEEELANHHYDCGTVRSIKNQIRHYARKLGLTYTQGCNLADRYS